MIARILGVSNGSSLGRKIAWTATQSTQPSYLRSVRLTHLGRPDFLHHREASATSSESRASGPDKASNSGTKHTGQGQAPRFVDRLLQRIVFGAIYIALCSFPIVQEYCRHVETVPATGRSRFINATKDTEISAQQSALRQVYKRYEKVILPPDDPRNDRVYLVGRKITRALRPSDYLLADAEVNREASWPGLKPRLGNDRWMYLVYDDPEGKAAYVTSSGIIWVSTGLLSECHDDNALALVLAHQMSHQLTRHCAELASTMAHSLLFGMPYDSNWQITDSLIKYKTLAFHNEKAQSLEKEADALALQLISRAGFDPEKALAVLPDGNNICAHLDNCTLQKIVSGKTKDGTTMRRYAHDDRIVEFDADANKTSIDYKQIRTAALLKQLPLAVETRLKCATQTLSEVFPA